MPPQPMDDGARTPTRAGPDRLAVAGLAPRSSANDRAGDPDYSPLNGHPKKLKLRRPRAVRLAHAS